MAAALEGAWTVITLKDTSDVNLVNGKDLPNVSKKVGPDNAKYDELKDEHLTDML